MVTTTTDRFQFERQLHGEGCSAIAGVDEAGRGPLAGPVVVAAVVLPYEWIQKGMPERYEKLNDSKTISERARQRFFDLLRADEDVVFAVVAVESAEIDQLNILNATHQGMARALERLAREPDHVLVDGLPVQLIKTAQTALVKGDSKSYSIAAASVLAKVTRDKQMVEFERKYPGYGFAKHKGYPTPAHLTALRELGPCPIHRTSFQPVREQQLSLL